jgi:hypothetical protein
VERSLPTHSNARNVRSSSSSRLSDRTCATP